MLTPGALLRILNELIFLMLGGFLVWAGLGSRFMFDPRKPSWLGLGAVIIYWGARALANAYRTPSRVHPKWEQVTTQIRGASLILVGAMMLALAFVQFRWVGTVLAMTGAILILRAIASVALAVRTS